MKILKIIGIIIAAFIGLVLILALLAPKTFDVHRKIVINASPEVVFSAVNGYKNWEHWSPWLERDSTIHNTYSGPEKGVGNKVAWTSKHSGNGSMENIETKSPNYMRTALTFDDFTPFESHFSFATVEGGTQVEWVDSGSSKFPMTIFNLFADKMMGPDFDRGLANLKKYVESLPKEEWKLGEYKIEEVPSYKILAVLDSCPANEIGKKLGGLYGEIGGVMRKNKLEFIGPVMAYYYSYTPEKTVLEAAVPVLKEIKGESRVKGRTTPKTRALIVSFFGDYMLMEKAIPMIKDYMQKNNLEQEGPELDIYLNDPTTVKSKIEIETKLNFPIK